MLYFCCDDDRREAVRGHPILNGIDFLEVVDSPAMPKAERQRTLRVYFLKPAGLAGLTPDNIRIEGGERIRHVRAVRVTVDEAEAHALVVDVNEPGDFSTYTLRLITSAANPTQPPGFDPVLSAVDFSFKV